jgi:acetyltransferase-like isoleucine patch superfamily enzyme
MPPADDALDPRDWLSQDELAARGWPATCHVHREARLPAHGVELGAHATIGRGVRVDATHVVIGEWSYLGARVRIRADHIRLGDNCIVFDRTTIMALRGVAIGPWTKIGRECRVMAGEIRIGCEFWMNERAEVGGGGWKTPGATLSIGDRCHLGRNSHVNVAEDVSWGDDTAVGMDCVLATHAHWQPVTLGYARTSGPIRLGSDVAIYTRVVVGPGVTIGAGATVAAGAVVTADVAPRGLAAGVPARVVRIQERLSDIDPVVRDMLRSVCLSRWPDAHLEDRPGWLRCVPTGETEELVWSMISYTASTRRVILVTTAPVAGDTQHCIVNVSERYMDGYASPLTEYVRNAFFRYGLRFRYQNYVRGRLDASTLEEQGLA